LDNILLEQQLQAMAQHQLLPALSSAPPPSSSSSNEMNLEHLRERARKHVEDAIRLIPLERKSAYLEAKRRAPGLVKTETDPLRFVRLCDYNAWAAAERLCKYWKERRVLFGDDRAFLPLILTGEGAMNDNDILTLQAGFLALLPRSKSGLQVVFTDRRQALSISCTKTRLRCCFYIVNILAEDDRAQTDGVIVLNLLVTQRAQDYDHSAAQSLRWLISDVFPIRAHIHVLSLASGGQNGMMQSIMDSYMSYMLERKSRYSEFHTHIEKEEHQMLNELLAMGLTNAGIPNCLGGSWDFIEAMNWCRARARFERKHLQPLLSEIKMQQPVAVPAPVAATAPAVVAPTIECAVPAASAAPLPRETGTSSASTTKDKAAKRRAENAIHSRRKRERRKHELMTLQKEQNQISTENQSLKAEHMRLKRLISEARELVHE